MVDLAAVAIDGGDLPLSGGLLALLRPALDALAPGGVLVVRSRAASVRHDLPSYCRVEHHAYLGTETEPDGVEVHRIRRGTLGVLPGVAERGIALPVREDRIRAADMLAAVPFPLSADVSSGLAPRGAQVEPGGPEYAFDLVERDRVAPPETAQLFDQAVAAQWDASREIPWRTIKKLPDALEHAVGQVMSFLAENELSALYVPSRFVSRIHPAYAEVSMFLATQMADEARHIDVFLKRARAAGGGVGTSSATTSHSLHALFDASDFLEATFLLSVLGEGTFLDLLRYVEVHAPDEATAEIARRTRADESRHVHFGLAHVRHGLATDPSLFARLEAAVRRRAATLHGVGGVPARIQDALTILAAGGSDPAGVRKGHEAFRALLDAMHEARRKRLLHAGFTPEQAEAISLLHTPNFM